MMGWDSQNAPYLAASEIERVMEEELRKAGMMPTIASPAVDVEAFIEQHLQASLDQYADLPPTVLGVTRFRPGRRPQVEVNADLTGLADDDRGPSWAPARLRSTMAHEASHIVLHTQLFDLVPEQQSLFAEERESGDPEAALLRCLKRDLGATHARLDRREYQANLGMAALLMPQSLFRQLAAPLRTVNGSGELKAAVDDLSHQCQTSHRAVWIRVQTLQILDAPAQRHLVM